MKNLILRLLAFTSLSIVVNQSYADTNIDTITYIRMEEHWAGDLEIAQNREQALARVYDKVEICNSKMQCMAQSTTGTFMDGSFMEVVNEELLLTVEGNQIKLGSLGENIRNGRTEFNSAYNNNRYALFEFVNTIGKSSVRSRLSKGKDCEISGFPIPTPTCFNVAKLKMKAVFQMDDGRSLTLTAKGEARVKPSIISIMKKAKIQ